MSLIERLAVADYIQIAILAAVFFQGFVAFGTFVQYKRLEKKRITTEFLNSIRSPMAEARAQVDELFGVDGTILLDKCTRNELVTLIYYLDYFEEIGAGVNEGIYDITMVDKIMGGIILGCEVRFSKFIRDIAIDQGRATIYREFSLLCAALRVERIRRRENELLNQGE